MGCGGDHYGAALAGELTGQAHHGAGLAARPHESDNITRSYAKRLSELAHA
jgi:hypothetical protein